MRKDKKERQEWSKQYYQKNKLQYRQSQFKRRLTAKELLYGNRKCEQCGESEIACLDFHHVSEDKDPIFKKRLTTLKERVSVRINNGQELAKIKNELSKCIVLCANCHRKHHYYQRIESAKQNGIFMPITAKKRE